MSIGPGMLKVDTHSQPAAPPTPLGHGVGAPSTSAANRASTVAIEQLGIPVQESVVNLISNELPKGVIRVHWESG